MLVASRAREISLAQTINRRRDDVGDRFRVRKGQRRENRPVVGHFETQGPSGKILQMYMIDDVNWDRVYIEGFLRPYIFLYHHQDPGGTALWVWTSEPFQGDMDGLELSCSRVSQ